MKNKDNTLFGFVILAIVMCIVVIWSQQDCWSSKDDYIFGYLVPIFVALIIYERWGLIKEIFIPLEENKNLDTDAYSPPAFIKKGKKAPAFLNIIFLLGTLFSILLFSIGAIGMTIYGSSAITTHQNTMGFIGTMLGILWFAGDKKINGEENDLRTKIRLLALFCFPVFVWFISGPFIFLVDSQIKALLLQYVTGTVVWLLNLLDFGVVQNANIIVLPGGDTVGVADACSGVRSITACVFAGAFLSAFFLNTIIRKLSFLGVSILCALFLNVMRTSFLTFWSIMHSSKALDLDFFGNEIDTPEFFLGTVHDVVGWAVMIITFIVLLFLIPLFKIKFIKTDAEMGFVEK